MHPKDIIDYECEDCDLHKLRTNVVWGNGNYLSKIAFIGESPGASEDEEGLAFVGESGILLMKTFWALKRQKKEFLYLNILRCRPPRNRNPSKIEIRACDKYLRKQIQCCPNLKVLVALGRVSWTALTGSELSVIANHGKVIKNGKFKILYTYHPSFLLRNRNIEIKKDFIRDIRKAINLSRGGRI